MRMLPTAFKSECALNGKRVYARMPACEHYHDYGQQPHGPCGVCPSCREGFPTQARPCHNGWPNV